MTNLKSNFKFVTIRIGYFLLSVRTLHILKTSFSFRFQLFQQKSGEKLFPFALRFLGTYQVSECVLNQINLSSYISTFISLTLLMGLVFQLPVLSFFLAKMGVLKSGFMKQYRRHAFVFITAISAIITPPDIFTCCMVMLPMYGLYEISIFVVGQVKAKQ